MLVLGNCARNYTVSGDNHDCGTFRGAAIDAA